jgi:hypothetical protein
MNIFFRRTMTVETKHMLRLRIVVIFDIFLKVLYSCKIAVLKTLGYESEYRIRIRIRIQPFKNYGPRASGSAHPECDKLYFNGFLVQNIFSKFCNQIKTVLITLD